jgi:CRP-like cAMP-binding protein
LLLFASAFLETTLISDLKMINDSNSQENIAPSAKLRAIGILAAARSTTRRELEEKSTLRFFEPGAPIWSAGDDFVAVIQSGQAKLQIMLNSGQSLTLYFLRVGDMMGLIENTSDKGAASLCLAVSVVTATIIPLSALHTALQSDSGFQQAILDAALAETAQLRQRLFEMATLSVQSRLATYLLNEASLNGNQVDIRNPLTHEELATLLGANREVITRALRAFEKLGLIAYSRLYLRILEPTKLQALASKG